VLAPTSRPAARMISLAAQWANAVCAVVIVKGFLGTHVEPTAGTAPPHETSPCRATNERKAHGVPNGPDKGNSSRPATFRGMENPKVWQELRNA